MSLSRAVNRQKVLVKVLVGNDNTFSTRLATIPVYVKDFSAPRGNLESINYYLIINNLKVSTGQPLSTAKLFVLFFVLLHFSLIIIVFGWLAKVQIKVLI